MKKLLVASLAAAAVTSIAMAAVPATCFGCHGKDGSKNTMVKESHPNTMTKADIKTALEGYRAGTRNTYGKAPAMVGQAKRLTDDQINAVAEAWGK